MITAKDSLPAGEHHKASIKIDAEHTAECQYVKDPHTGDVTIEFEEFEELAGHQVLLTLFDHDRTGNTSEYVGTFDSRGVWVPA